MNKNLNLDINFIIEIDKMKNVLRKIKILNEYKLEDDAEHSYHVSLMSVILSDYVDYHIDLLKVVKMLLIHDIVEIDAGDTYAFDTEGYKTKAEREKKAADRIFNLLSPNKAIEYRELFDEFENMHTNESKYANLIDRMQPIMLNSLNNGGTWKEHGIKREQVYARIEFSKDISLELYNYTKFLIDRYFDGV